MLQIVSRLNTEQFDTKINKTLPFLRLQNLFEGAPRWPIFQNTMNSMAKNQ